MLSVGVFVQLGWGPVARLQERGSLLSDLLSGFLEHVMRLLWCRVHLLLVNEFVSLDNILKPLATLWLV